MLPRKKLVVHDSVSSTTPHWTPNRSSIEQLRLFRYNHRPSGEVRANVTVEVATVGDFSSYLLVCAGEASRAGCLDRKRGVSFGEILELLEMRTGRRAHAGSIKCSFLGPSPSFYPIFASALTAWGGCALGVGKKIVRWETSLRVWTRMNVEETWFHEETWRLTERRRWETDRLHMEKEDKWS